MKKTIILSLLILFSALTVFAQTDKNADITLNQLSENLKSLSPVIIDFTYKIEDKKVKQSQSFSGTITSHNNWYTIKFADKEIYCDGENIWTYFSDINEVEISSIADTEEPVLPLDIISGYKNNYKARFSNNKGIVQTIDLFPIKSDKNIVKVVVSFDQPKKLVKQLQIFDRDGIVNTYIIKSINSNKKLTKSDFTFNKTKYPNVEIIDMR